MYVVAVSIEVKPENREQFITATRINHEGTRTEPANVRFDVLQLEENPNRFMLYEVYKDKSAFEAHQKTAHYLTWKETVKEWMAVPRQGLKHRNLFPEDARW